MARSSTFSDSRILEFLFSDEHLFVAGRLVDTGAAATQNVPEDGSDRYRDSVELPQGSHHAVMQYRNRLMKPAHCIVQNQLHALHLNFSAAGCIRDYLLQLGHLAPGGIEDLRSLRRNLDN